MTEQLIVSESEIIYSKPPTTHIHGGKKLHKYNKRKMEKKKET